jgi:predicted nucleotidyltransferase
MQMKSQDIKSKIERLKPILKEHYQVKTIGFFGSYAKGEQKRKSDIDILVEFVEGNSVDLFDFVELEDFLTKQLGIKVDLATKNALKPLIKDQILKETIYA